MFSEVLLLRENWILFKNKIKYRSSNTKYSPKDLVIPLSSFPIFFVNDLSQFFKT